ncbi:MAG: type II toxin-antitoxin system RelE/ParE family toxin [Burkholderiales bacterium]|nr:MAG: type II toxin-antitoxin system RelE/ParE family toxin [Burkholderiales bacterium]
MTPRSFLGVRFFRTESGTEPVRDGLRALSAAERRILGEDIKTVQLGWPLGMPLVRSLGDGLWEIRCGMEQRIARIVFCLEGSTMVLLHAFFKKQQKTPKADLDLSLKRLRLLRKSK